jgi:chaperonin GroEL (HSP60 family)
VVAQALKAPFLQIVKNHGHVHPPVALAQAQYASQRAGRAHGFDACTGQVVPMVEAGIIDSHPVARAALAASVSAAGTAITTDVIVLRARR